MKNLRKQGYSRIGDLSVRKLMEMTKALTGDGFYEEASSKLYKELGGLAKYITETRRKLQSLPESIKFSYKIIPEASNQLSDIGKTTEAATHRILSLTEKILKNQRKLSGQIAKLVAIKTDVPSNGKALESVIKTMKRIDAENQDSLTEVLAALSFQDLTGQKIKKLINLMEDVERKVWELIVAFGISKEDAEYLVKEVERRQGVVGKVTDPSESIGSNQGLVDEILASLRNDV
ncbi:MAG: protein phosphatase CheZ [Pseudomonadota bacterium]